MGWGGVGWDGQGGCEQRIEVIVKMHIKSRRVSGWGGQGGCEQRTEVIVKLKKVGDGVGWTVWIEVIVRMKKVGVFR